MALVRAMGSALSGMSSQQFKLDAIGNNLANSTTTGFKSSRVDFETLLSQTLRFGSAPQGQLGGVDPLQMGLGVQVSSISRNFSQGELATTGVASDLALDGEGFFIGVNGAGESVYTRDGSFAVNSQGLLTDPSTGTLIQGVNAEYSTFTIPLGGALEAVSIPVGNLQIASQTANAVFDGNLNSAGDVANMGTVLQSSQLVDNTAANAPATAATLLVNLSRAGGAGFVDMTISAGDTLTLNATKGGRPLPETRFFVGTSLPAGFDGFGTTLGEFASFIEDSTGINTSSALNYGAIRDDDTNPNTPGVSFSAPVVFAPSAAAAWTLTEPSLVNWTTDEGVQVGDIIRFNTGLGAGQTAVITAIAGNTLTFGALSGLQPLPASGDQYTIHQPAGATIVDSAATPWLTDGALLVAGNPGAANQIENLVITNTSNSIAFAPFAQIEAASGESVTTTAVVYDSIGTSHQVDFTFVLEAKGVVDPGTGSVGNTWRVYTESEDNNLLSGGGTILGTDRVAGGGALFFGDDGQFLTQAADALTGFVTLNLPNSGPATPMIFAPDFSAMTGFADDQSVAFMTEQDGLATGILSDYAIGETGVVTGIFTNGATRELAQLSLARFQNPNGLIDKGGNYFQTGINSGPAIVGRAGEQGLGAIVGGALEASNVDFAKEFSDLIIAQRAFQANARVITRSDQLLEELVNIV